MTPEQVITAILEERKRQEAKHPEYTCAGTRLGARDKLAVLTEEVGEVAHELCEGLKPAAIIDRKALRAELVQVAAVAFAWLESL